MKVSNFLPLGYTLSMKITFLGTGADTAYPLPFCLCPNCKKARELGGKNLRKRSSIVINNDLLIDLGPDTMSSSFLHSVNISNIRCWLQTHSHADHFDPAHLSTRITEYAVVDVPPLNLYASELTLQKMSEMLRSIGYINDIQDHKEQKRLNLKVNIIKPNQTVLFGSYEVTGFKTNHDNTIESLVYAVKENDKTVLYATDTDDLPEETWKGIHNNNLEFDLVVLDHTYGPNINGGGHLNAIAFEKHIKMMKELGMLKETAQIFATHISHEGNPIHHELETYAREHGYNVAYDGLIINV